MFSERSSLPRSIDKIGPTARGIGSLVVIGLIVLFVLFGLFFLWCWPRHIGGSGGLPIPGEILISVPQFLQGDPRWRDDPLGDTPGTLGGEGCAIASASMVLGHYRMSVDPKHLNRFLREHNGFEGQGWLRWESAAEFAPGLIEKAYEDLPSFLRIDWNLLRGNPVIVRIRRPAGITHFVVIVGKRGLDYLIRDPAGSGGGLVYPFRELGVPIEALRYYRRLPSAESRTSSRAMRLIKAIAAR
jgi:hypothetical protein